MIVSFGQQVKSADEMLPVIDELQAILMMYRKNQNVPYAQCQKSLAGSGKLCACMLV